MEENLSRKWKQTLASGITNQLCKKFPSFALMSYTFLILLIFLGCPFGFFSLFLLCVFFLIVLESRGLPWQRHALPWLPCRPKRRIAPTVHTSAKQKKMPHDQDYKLARFAKYGPPPLTSEEKTKQEKGFILDAIAVSTLSDDSGRANPKMATAIPPYNGQKDKHAKGYFERPVVQKLLNKTEQVT